MSEEKVTVNVRYECVGCGKCRTSVLKLNPDQVDDTYLEADFNLENGEFTTDRPDLCQACEEEGVWPKG